MKSRAKFLKSELNHIYNLLNVSYEYADCAQVDDNKRFIKIFELLMEIREKIKYIITSCEGKLFYLNLE